MSDKYAKDLNMIEEYEGTYSVTKGFLPTDFLNHLAGYLVKEMIVIKHHEDIDPDILVKLKKDKYSMLWTYAVGLGIPSENGGFFLIQSPNSFVIMKGFNEDEEKLFEMKEVVEGSYELIETELLVPNYDDFMKSTFGGFIGEGSETMFEDIIFAKYGKSNNSKLS